MSLVAKRKAVKEWLEKTYPKIKRKAKKQKAEIYFGDEAGMRSDHHAVKGSFNWSGSLFVISFFILPSNAAMQLLRRFDITSLLAVRNVFFAIGYKYTLLV